MSYNRRARRRRIVSSGIRKLVASTKTAARGEVVPQVKASVQARKLATENGIELTSIKGTGKNGAIGVGDVRASIPA